MYYYGARCYDPLLGRFTTADPIVPDPTNPQSLNRYSYVLNNPLKYIDPSGHSWLDWFQSGLSRLTDNISGTVQSFEKVIDFVSIAITAGQLTDRAVGNSAQSSRSGFYGQSGGSGRYQADGGTAISASANTFYGKGSSKRGYSSSGSRGLGDYGLEAGQPDKDGNYNPDDAVWRLLNAVQSTGGIKERGNASPSRVNSDMISGGLIVMGKGLIFIFGTFGTPAFIVGLPVGAFDVGLGLYILFAGTGLYPLNPWEGPLRFLQKRDGRE